ncbi:methyl-accepting chemotaxis protein [Spirochaetota bacterium]
MDGKMDDAKEFDTLAKLSEELRDRHLRLADQLWSLTMESNLTADFFMETIRANTANVEAARAIGSDLSSLEAGSIAIAASAAEAGASLDAADGAFKTSLSSLASGSEALERMDYSIANFLDVYRRLADAIDRIEGTLASIDEISELTNLLSMNAAIEAARAGVNGKGFKVVADEVKRLAGTSKELTQTGSGVLQELRNGMADAEAGLETIQAAKAELAGRMTISREEQGRSSEAMSGAAANMRDIQSALEGQTRSTGRISASMASLAGATDLLAESSELITGTLERQQVSVDGVLSASSRLKESIIGVKHLLCGSAGYAEEGSFAIGHDVSYPPWVYIKGGRSSGITVDVARAFAKSYDTKAVFKPSQFAAALEDLFSGAIDLIANVGWPNAFFDGKPVIATVPFASFKPVVFALHKDREKFTSMADLKGKRVAAQKGSYVNDCLKGIDCRTVAVTNDVEAFAAVIWKRADCAITEQLVGSFLSESLFSGKLVSCFSAGKETSVVFLLHSKDAELRNKINAWLALTDTRLIIDSLLNG